MSLSQDELIRLANNPIRGVNKVIQEIEHNWFKGEVQINSKSHPFVLATDLILSSTHGLLNRIDDGISELFPVHARDVTDLSKHMSDEDKIGIFAEPSDVVLQLAIEEKTLLNVAQSVVETMGKASFEYKVVLIPKDTEVTILGYTFAIMNGITIRYSDRTGYIVSYDNSTNNPLEPISNNLLDKFIKVSGNDRYLVVDVPAKQLNTTVVENITSNESSGCTGEIEYQDYLHAVRAFFIRDNSNTLKEINVNYDQDVFDPLELTLALRIDTSNKKVYYEIPDVYINNRLGLGVLRIYVYTTKGELIKDFTDVNYSEISINYQDYRYGAGNLNNFSKGLKTVGGVIWTAKESTSGGVDARGFAEIKAGFLKGRRTRNIPVTENNLTSMLSRYGYGSVKSIDFLTGRSYTLTRELPVQDNKGFNSAMNCFVGSHLTSINELINSGVCIDNGMRVTIPHNVLFDITNPTIKLINSLTLSDYMGLSDQGKVDLFSRRSFAYTPFYYVIDMTQGQVVLRTYHLDEPMFKHQTFKAENSALGIELGIGNITIVHQEDGYLIEVVTQSGDSYKELDHELTGIQLRVKPTNSNTHASIIGEFVGLSEDDERVFHFKLESSFDVDLDGNIYFTNLNQFGSLQPTTGIPLETNLDFIMVVSGDKENTATDMDEKIDQSLFLTGMIGVMETSYVVTFGKELETLYNRIRPIVGDVQFERYSVDIPEVYTENTFKRNIDGELVFDTDGLPIIENRAGDPVMTSRGDIVHRHRRGDVVKDEYGKPIQVAPREVKYHWDFIAFDGVYFISNDQYDLEFAQDTKSYFTKIIDRDLRYFNKMALDRTTLVYQPRGKLGFKQVVVNDNFQQYAKQDLSFTVNYYLTAAGNRSSNLKASLTKVTPNIINKVLYNATTVSISDITEALKEDITNDVVAIKVEGLSGGQSIEVLSNIDDLDGFSIKKKLRAAGDGVLTIEEDVTTNFLPHDVTLHSALK